VDGARFDGLSVVAATQERIKLGVLERRLAADLQRHPWLPGSALEALFDQYAAHVRDRWPLPASLARAVAEAAGRARAPTREPGPCTDPDGCVLCGLLGGRPGLADG